MADIEKKKKKMLLKGIEKLSDLGGFIKEEIEDEINELYQNDVLEITEKYFPLGAGFCDVADAVENAIKNANKYADIEYDEYGETYLFQYSGFDEWAIDQIARLTAEKFKNEKNSFWISWNLTRETRKALQGLNALDERILYLISGINNKNKLTAKQISELPEFSCKEEFITTVIDVIETSFKHFKNANDDFEKECNAHRLRCR